MGRVLEAPGTVALSWSWGPMTKRLEFRSNTAASGKLGLGPACLVLAASLAASGMAVADTVRDCEQIDSAPLVVRACSALMAEASLDPMAKGRVFTMRGIAWLKEEEPAAAISDFTRAINLDAGNINAIKGRAKAYTLLGNHDLAAADWASIIGKKPNDEEAYRNKAAAHLAAGRSGQALADYSKAIEIDPKSVEAYIGRAGVYEHLNEREKSMGEFSAALQIDPAYIPTYLARAEAAERWGDHKLAIDSYVTLLKYNGVFWQARKALQRLGVSNQP